MKRRTDNRNRTRNWRLLGWGAAALLLLLPLVAGAPWTLFDYAIVAIAFALVGGAFELAVRRSGDRRYRAGSGVALLTGLVLLWVNGAVGIVGSETEPVNLLFGLVPAVAAAGAIVARFEPAGMARAMLLAAATQALVAVPAASAASGSEIAGLAMLSVLFAGGWLLSAWLFARAARAKAA